MAELIAHDCPVEGDEVWVRQGNLCPNGCGWLAHDGEVESDAVKAVRTEIERWGFLPLAEAARAAEERTGRRFPYSTVAQAAAEGRLPAIQVGKRAWIARPEAIAARLGLHMKRGRPYQK